MSIARLVGFDVALLRRRGALLLAGGTVAAAALLVALGFAARAAEMALSRHYDPETAALVVAGSAFALVVATVVAMAVMVRRTRREVGRAVRTSAMVTLGPPAVSLAVRHAGLAAVAVVAGLGFWLARRDD